MAKKKNDAPVPESTGEALAVRPPMMDRALWERSALIVKGDMTFEEWNAIGAWLEAVQTGVQWWVGDWMNYGEGQFGEKYAQAIDATGWSISTLEVYAWVCKKIAPAQRRADLSFSHHKEVADLAPGDQVAWLDKAISGEDGDAWSSDRLRRELKAKKLGSPAGLWVLVEAKDEADAEKLIAQMSREGRSAKRK